MTLPPGAVPLLIGTLLALVALSFVLYPLLQAVEDDASASPRRLRIVTTESSSDEGTAEAALREIEFDRETGKLSDEDYEELKADYAARAQAERRLEPIAVGAAGGVAASASIDDAVEAAVRAAESRRPQCTSCGPRPESDATWCSNCGRYLPGACASCGTAITAEGARFCTGCGTQLKAAA